VAERLRKLLERPLDPRAGRAVIVLAAAIFAGLALLGMLAGTAPDRPGRSSGTRPAPKPVGRPVEPKEAPRPLPARPPAPLRHAGHPRQDPQDRRGSAAARRAERELSAHRALQHVPYHRGGLAITLVGARGERAVLRVSAPTLATARQGWRRFLRRYHDDDSAYLPRFEVRGGAGG
jgi:hypothetical protein